MTVPIRISASMLRNHLSVLTVGWFDHRNLPPPTVEGYGPLIGELRDILTESGDLPWFILGLQHVLATPAVAANELVNTRFAYSDRDGRAVMAYVLSQLAPGQGTDPRASRVVLEEMSRADWAAVRETEAAA